MKISELIEELQHADPELPVYVWVDGERLEVTMVDHSFTDQAGGFIEINAEPATGQSWPSVYIVTNHNGTELGQFDTLKEAQAEANFYISQTGNPAFIDEDLKAPAY
jgi:hypothetical protein